MGLQTYRKNTYLYENIHHLTNTHIYSSTCHCRCCCMQYISKFFLTSATIRMAVFHTTSRPPSHLKFTIIHRSHNTPLAIFLYFFLQIVSQFSHDLKGSMSAKCVYCPDSDETVEHFLFHCPLYDHIRSRLLPAQRNIHNTLYGSTTQLQRTATYNMSAMSRRDKIVGSLGDQVR